MNLSLLKTVLFTLIGSSAAWAPKGHDYHPPFPTDSRSPCPGLNALANHNYLPRHGKDIDINDLRNAVSQGYNYLPNSFDAVFNLALNFKLTTTGNASTINLQDLAKHDDIEIDGSLSRNDIYFGDNLHFDPSIWKMTAAHLGLYDTFGDESKKYLTVEVAARARAARVADAKSKNPEFNASAAEMMGSPGTTGLYLTTLWDDKAGAAPKSWVRAFFEQERIAYLEGYRPPVVPRTFANVTAMVERVMAVDV